MMPKEESKKQLITRATQYGVDPTFGGGNCISLNDVESIITEKMAITRKKYNLPKDKKSLLDRIFDFLSLMFLKNASKETSPTSVSIKLARLISDLKDKTGKDVVVLIDEYDLPILEVLQNPSKAREHCDYLRGFYGTLKENQKDIHFIFITGISMFSKVNLFSKINHLVDISMVHEFSTICGYTANDLKTVFAPEIKSYDFEKIRRWYDGYSWDFSGQSARVFCPYSVLQLFLEKDFGSMWYQECVPQYLYELMRSKKIKSINISDREITKPLLKRFDISNPDINTLLFQNGYLTIRQVETNHGEKGDKTPRLVYPNLEVARSMSQE